MLSPVGAEIGADATAGCDRASAADFGGTTVTGGAAAELLGGGTLCALGVAVVSYAGDAGNPPEAGNPAEGGKPPDGGNPPLPPGGGVGKPANGLLPAPAAQHFTHRTRYATGHLKQGLD